MERSEWPASTDDHSLDGDTMAQPGSKHNTVVANPAQMI